MTQIGPTFIGFDNYIKLFEGGDIWIYAKNTMVLWLMCFIPQIYLVPAAGGMVLGYKAQAERIQIFQDSDLSAEPDHGISLCHAVLYTVFRRRRPINSLLMQIGFIDTPYKFLSNTGSARGLIALMNCLMWFGNTTILLMAGMMGIDTNLFEAAEVDGATSTQVFYKITLPLLRPILVYVIITSLIGGLQLFDVPQILTNGTGDPMRSTMTLIMFLNKHLFSKNYWHGRRSFGCIVHYDGYPEPYRIQGDRKR